MKINSPRLIRSRLALNPKKVDLIDLMPKKIMKTEYIWQEVEQLFVTLY